MTAGGDHFSTVSSQYAAARPTYPDALFAALASLAPNRALAWDVGCGSGQASVALAAHMERVHATDVSAAQIAAAAPHERVTYAAAPAHSSGLPDGSVSLVTVAQALHWFDVDAFHAEVRRVLAPGGVVAEWCYGLIDTPPAVAKIVNGLDARMQSWWPPERRHVDAAYASLPFPFAALPFPFAALPLEGFAMTVTWSVSQLMAYLGTWSAVTRCRAAGGGDPLDGMEAALVAAYDGAETAEIAWPLTVRVGRA